MPVFSHAYLFFFLQILEVNNRSFEHISHSCALEILRGTTHLAITVKTNLHGMYDWACFTEYFVRVAFIDM